MGDGKDIRRIKKGCGSRELRDLLLAAVSAGYRYKMTRSGIILYGPDAIAGTHLSGGSDPRAVKNVRADFRRAGIIIEKGK